MFLLLSLFFFHTQLRGFIPVEFTWSFNQFLFFSDYIKNNYKHTKSLRAASDYPQGNRTYDVIYMTLQSFYKVVLFVAVSTLCVPLYKAFPHLFGTFDIRDSITYIVYWVIRFSLYAQVWLTSSVILTNKGFWKQDNCIYRIERHERSAAFINLLTS